MKRWLFNIFIAMAMLISVPASAGAFDKSYEINQPLYDSVTFTADTADPVAVAMATGGSDIDIDSTAPCMASCSKVTDNILADNSGLVKWPYGRTVMVAYSDTVTAYKATVLACSNGQSAHQPLLKVPIAA